MTATTIRVQMAQRKDTAANWTAANPILLSGEIGYETDTKKFKIGNGSTNWNSLTYLPIPDGSGNLTITGNLEIGSTGSLTFEGSTADGFETTLAVTNPTADRTITLPNQSGTVLLSGNASIVDADIAANAEIAVSKLADGTARQLLQTDAAGTGVEWTSNVDIPGTLDVTGTATFDGAVTVAGDLTVNGTTTTISTQNLLVEDKNIIIGDVASPTDVTADGGGITLKGATDKTINWVDATDAWTLSEHVNIASSKEYRIAGIKVLDATSLGSSVLITSANITDGTIVDGDINASAAIAGTKISPDFGSQNVTTTGTVTGASLNPTSSTVPTNGVYLPSANTVGISTNSSERIRIGANGEIGIGGANYGTSGQVLTSAGSGAAPTWQTPAAGNADKIEEGNSSAEVIDTGSDGRFVVTTEGSERARVDSSGRLLVGTSSGRTVGNTAGSIQIEGVTDTALTITDNSNGSAGDSTWLTLARTRGTAVGGTTAVSNGDWLGNLDFAGHNGSSFNVAARISGQVDGAVSGGGVGDMPGRLVFSTTADGASSPTEQMRITASGRIGFKCNPDATFPVAVSASGANGSLVATDGSLGITTNGATCAYINRNNADGDLIRFYEGGNQEGAISVSGTTVTYGGGHLARWSQLPNDEDPSKLLKGTVMSNLDEMCEWGEEDNEQLNKTKISDVEGDPNVAGVFVAASPSDEGPLDFFVGMTGDMIIRIASGVTVQRGDLLMSAGDGTAKPQDDDIIRSKTIAKVTSTNVSCTYDDGSYCVPCVLMAC